MLVAVLFAVQDFLCNLQSSRPPNPHLLSGVPCGLNWTSTSRATLPANCRDSRAAKTIPGQKRAWFCQRDPAFLGLAEQSPLASRESWRYSASTVRKEARKNGSSNITTNRREARLSVG